MDLISLKIDDLIIHEVPRKPRDGEPPAEPILSTISDPQTPEVRRYFIERLRKVMNDRGFKVERQAGLDTEGSDAIIAILRDSTSLVSNSQVLASRLFAVQDGRSPEGILVVAACELEGAPAVGILKLEHERGVQAEQTETPQGLLFRIVLHEDLMLTKRTAVFKAAVFKLNNADEFEGLASDNQVETRVAGFFLKDLLGCWLVKDPAITTAEYFDAAESFIATVPDPERKARYEMALLTQMHSPTLTAVDPVQFAETNLEIDDQQPFFDHLRDQEVGEARFARDTTEIAGRIRRMAIDFDSGIKLFGNPEAMNEHVDIGAQQDDGSTTVTVTDQVNKIHARG